MALCSSALHLKSCALPRRQSAFHPIAHRNTLPPLRAADGPGDSSGSSPAPAEKEARVEALEASIRGKAPRSAPRPPTAAKPIPIRGMTQQQGPKLDSQYENMAEWKEGQLFPEGWDKMPLGQKITELYLGRRGVLFWANKAAYTSAIVLLVAWVAFRFVGPNLGLYQLQGDLMSPTM